MQRNSLDSPYSLRSSGAIRIAVALVVASGGCIPAAFAQTWTWKTDGDGRWSDPANWIPPANGRPFPNGKDHVAVLGNAITAARVITLDVDINLKTLRFEDDDGYTVQSQTNQEIKFPTNTAPGRIEVLVGSEHQLKAGVFLTNDLEIDVATHLEASVRRIAGFGKVSKLGKGAVLLTAKQVYRGNTEIQSGTIRIGAVDSCLPMSTVLMNDPLLGDAGTLEFGDVALNGPGFSQIVKSVRGDVSIKNVHPTATGHFVVQAPDNGDDCSGKIGGFLNLSKYGPNAWTISGDNTFVGNTIVYGGSLKLGSDNSLGPLISLATDVNTAGTLDLNGFDPLPFFLGDGTFLEGLERTKVRNTGAGMSTFQIGAQNGFTHGFGGTIEDSIALVVLGAGDVVLAGANTYTGGTKVIGRLAVNNKLGSGTGTGAVEVTTGLLQGEGSIAGAVTVKDNGQLAPGYEGSTLTTGALTLSNASQLYFFLDKPNQGGGLGDNAFLVVNGALVLDGVLNVKTAAQNSNFGVGRYRLMRYVGPLTNNVLTVGTIPQGFTGKIDVTTNPNIVELVVAAAGG